MHATVIAVTPSLRVIGLAYTGLGGLLAITLVISVALVPMGPALQQVAEPARQAMSNFVQPTTDAVTTFLGGGPVVHGEPLAQAGPPGRPSALSDVVRLEVTIGDALPLDEPIAVVAAAAPRTAAAQAETPAPQAVDEIVGLEPIEISSPHAVAPVVTLPAPTAGQQIASHEAPKLLPTITPTETPRQLKARLDVENQTAIDAAKAVQARAKADADAANNAAIAARKAAATATATGQQVASASAQTAAVTDAGSVTGNAPATPGAAAAQASNAPTVKSSNKATPVATPQSKAAANAANQAAIDAARLAQARAKTEANAVNQAALAAKTGKPSAKSTPTPTVQPTSPPAQPTVQPSPTASVAPSVAGVTAESQAPALSADVVEQQVDEAFLENVPVDQASTLPDLGDA